VYIKGVFEYSKKLGAMSPELARAFFANHKVQESHEYKVCSWNYKLQGWHKKAK
jgi:hypothetical protein